MSTRDYAISVINTLPEEKLKDFLFYSLMKIPWQEWKAK